MIKIWWCNIDDFSEADFNKLLTKFSKDEQDEILRYRFLRDQLLRLIGRLMVKMKYGNFTEKIERSQSGKPYFESGKKFNISHSSNLVAVGFSSDEIGIDVEFKKDVEIEGFINYFHPDEIQILERFDNVQKSDQFYKMWTRKEAYLKATGQGILNGLNHRNCLADFVLEDSKKWFIQSMDLFDHYSLAVSSNAKIESIEFKEITRSHLVGFCRVNRI